MHGFGPRFTSLMKGFQSFRTTPHNPPKKPIVTALLCILFLSWTRFLRDYIPFYSTTRILPATSNSTLGFQKVYALVLPEREDRRKPLFDAANATNITVTVLDGVRDADAAPERPYDWRDGTHSPGQLGCLAAHVRTWQLMVENNISSALILESDADWDLRIKSTMSHLATGVRTLLDWPFNAPHNTQDTQISPYGDSWDLLWLGHCGLGAPGNVRRYTWNDSSVPPQSFEWTFDSGLSPEQHIAGTRAIFPFDHASCSSGYAVSLQGARKLINYFRQTDEGFDMYLARVCRIGVDMACLGVWPMMITGSPSPSNIDASVDAVEGAARSMDDTPMAGPGLQFSARVNAKRILEEGVGESEWIAEWDSTWGIGDEGWELLPLN